MLPTAILAGLLVGIWMRWWAVPMVAGGWATTILFVEPAAVVFAALLGAATGAFGVLLALGTRRLASGLVALCRD